ncbi:hypothetical protein Hhel01_01789 [Haloferula helveola]
MSSASAQQAGASPVRIFIMAGQSNMLGKGKVTGVTTPGTLDYTVANDPDGRYQFLQSGGSWVVRDDVWIRDQDPVTGGLTVGFGGEAADLIGPELGFGHKIGDFNDSQVLIVKCAWGGKDLDFNFCPPSRRVGEPAPVTSSDKGFYYEEILRLVSEATTNLGTYFTDYDGGGYEIAGFCWHQGWNDRINAARSAAYETNMAAFIEDIRTDLATPGLPFVIATTGMDGLDGYGYTQVEQAQLAMADPVAYPAFDGNVAVVDARGTYKGLDFWQTVANSPNDEGYHWNRNAKTYLHLGLAMGDAMSLLSPGRCPYRLEADGGSGGVTLSWQNGTETPTSVRVLRGGVEIAAAAPADPPVFVDAGATLGVNDYELQFTMPGDACDPLTLSFDTGISGLEARRRLNGVNLSWDNNLSYTAVKVSRNGAVIAASLPPNTTSYVDNSPPAGLLTYEVEPTDPGTTAAEVQIEVSAAPSGTAVIYEPFDMTAGAGLDGNPGGLGIDGEWVAGSTLVVDSTGMTFGTLPTFGNSIIRTSGNGSCSINLGSALGDAGLLDDGAELWFSFLCPNPDNINVSPTFALGNESLSNATTVANSGSGIGARIQQGRYPQGMIYSSGGVAGTTPDQTTLGSGELALVVGHITWGADAVSLDTIEIYTPGTDLVLDTPQSISAIVDQSTFQVLSMWGNVTAPNFDEIRFGATYDDVVGQGVDTSDDFTPPTPGTMSFSSPPAAVSDTTITMTATAASDTNGVEYYFACTAGGGNDSGWQDSPVYTDTGLSASTLYSYTVQARDKSINQNPNNASPAASATTLAPDTNPPPVPSFASAPAAVSFSEITMTASAVIDPEGNDVEYYFTCTSVGGNDSGWQSGTTYVDSGLTPDTEYTYTVKARDTASVPNETAESAPASATTDPYTATDGTWGFDADGNWEDDTKWLANTVAEGPGATAFLTQDITNDRTIYLALDRTIGSIVFTDSPSSSSNLSLAGTGNLILEALSGTPVIDVTQNGRQLTINNVIEGTQGLQKNGPGRLFLSANNTYSGPTLVTDGFLSFLNISLAGFGGGRDIEVSEGAIVQRNWPNMDNAFLNRLVETSDEIGIFLTATGGSYNGNDLDFSSGGAGADLPNAFLGTWAGNGAKSQYDGTITPASDNYRLGFPGQSGSLHIRPALPDVGGTPRGLIVGGGAVIIAGDNTFTGDTVLRDGRLFLGRQLCLQNSALNVGNGAGDGITGQMCFLASGSGGVSTAQLTDQPTLGGLIGARNLASIYNSSNQNNTSRLGIGSVLGITLDVDAGKSFGYSGNARLSSTMFLTKTGDGTQVLSGNNDYTGATTVSGGTLALVGGSHTSPITVGVGAALGFTLGSPTTSTSTVDLTSGTVKITGAVDNASDYLLMTASGITGVPTLDSAIPGYELQKLAGDTELTLVFVGGGTPYATWSGGALFEDDDNGDGVDNGMAFILGASDPNASAVGLLPQTGSEPGFLTLTFQRLDGIAPAVLSVEYGPDLSFGNTDVIPLASQTLGSGVEVVVVDGSPTDTVTIKIPDTFESGAGTLFARLSATEN